MLTVNDVKIVTIALEGLENVSKIMFMDFVFRRISFSLRSSPHVFCLPPFPRGPASEQILKVGEDEAVATGTHNQMSTYVAEAEGLNKIEELQQHSNNDIYEKCIKILETFFGVDEEEEMANIVPEMAEGGNQFAFSAPTQVMDDDGGSAPTFDFSG